MIKRRILKSIILINTLLFSHQVFCANKQYIREHEYVATEFDTKYTSRVNAIDGVKQDLLEELGTYVSSILKVSVDIEGNKYASRDYVAITAGITRLDVLKEDWDRIRYYVEASMQADPEEVMRSVQAMRDDHRLEDSLRESLDEINKARKSIVELKKRLTSITKNDDASALNLEYVSAVRDIEVEASYQKALKAKIDGNFQLALKSFAVLADKGYAKAQSRLGLLYQKGMGVSVNYEKAMYWYKRAAALSSPKAYARLGYLYERGLGVGQDYGKAFELYKKSSELDSGMGHARLGWLYQVGKGTNKDINKVLDLYRKAISKGSNFGYARLGYMYQKGIGVKRDRYKAFDLYEKAASKGNGFGLARLGLMYFKGWGVIDIDYEQALVLFQEAVRRGNPFGIARLGVMYEEGIEVEQDTEEAWRYYMKAADLKSGHAMYRMGLLYEKGKGVSRDKDAAINWYRKASDLGNRKAKKRLHSL